MSFGRPPSFMQFSAAPPDRGSFPLDHEGECKAFMQAYLSCLKENQNNNGKCRQHSKLYLECRMDKGLMGRDSFENLGYGDLKSETPNQDAKNVPSHTDPKPTKTQTIFSAEQQSTALNGASESKVQSVAPTATSATTSTATSQQTVV